MRGVVCEKKHPTLWLLHGMSDDHTTWMRHTSIERYASAVGLAVVMPAVELSWYQNMAAGPAYGTFLREELPQIARSFFPLSHDRKDNFVAGLSMGGYGAFLLALSQPERFAAAASLSGALDIARLIRNHKEFLPVLKAAFGQLGKVRGSESDLFSLSEKLVLSKGLKPALYACCGSEDFLLSDNHHFVTHAKKIGLPLLYEEHFNATHEWGYWDQQIQRVIQWLPL
jgi:S-formylglutathione hydrolase FrmB